MKRLVRWTLRILRVVALLALILLVLGVTVLPGWVEKKTTSALREAGFEEAVLEVRYVGMRGAGVAAVELGAGNRFRADHVLLDYGVSGLLDGRVKAVTVSGARWHVSYRDGVLDWAPFSDLRSDGEGGGELPFDRVSIRSGRLHFDWEEKSLIGVIDGELRSRSAGRLDFDLTLDCIGTEWALSGTADLRTGAIDLSITGGAADVASVVDGLPGDVLTLPGRLGGQLRLDVTGRWADDAFVFEGRGGGESLSWFGQVGERPFGARRGTMTLKSVRGTVAAGRFELEEGGVELSCHDVRFGGLPPLHLSLAARHAEGDGTEGRARLHDPAGEARTLDVSATARGDLAASPAAPVEASLTGSMALRLLKAIDPSLVVEGVVLDEDAMARSELDLHVEPPEGDGEGWRVEAEGELAASASQVRLPGIGARLRRVRLQSDVALSLRDTDVVLAVRPGSRVVADEVRLRQIGGRPRVTGEGDGTLSVELKQAGRLDLEQAGDARRITGSIGELALTAHGLRLRSDEIDVEDLEIALLAALDVGDETAALRLLSGSALRLEGACSIPGELELEAEPGRPLVEVLVDDELLIELERARPGIWRLEGPATTLRAAGTARSAAREMVVEGFDFEGSVAVSGSKDDVELALREDGALGWRSVRSERPDVDVSLGPGRCRLSGREGAARFHVGFGADAPSVRGRLVARGLDVLKTGDPALGSLELRELTLDAELRVDAEGWKTEVAVDATAKPRLTEAAIPGLDVSWDDVLGLKARVVGRVDGVGTREPRWELELEAATSDEAKPLLAKWSDGEVIVGAASLRVRGEIKNDRPVSLRGELKVTGSELFYRPASLTVSGVSVALPFAFGTELVRKGKLSAGTIWLGDDFLPEISGEVGFEEGRLELAADWQLFEGATARIEGWLLPLERIPRGGLTVDLPTVTFDDDTQPGEVFTTLSDYVFGGELSLAARIDVDGPRITPDVNLNLAGLSLSSEVLKLSASGIDADITVDGFAPLSTPGAQRLTIEKGVLGKLRVDDGELLFRLESAESLFIEEASFGWVGGRLYTHAVRFDPAESKLDLVVYADHLQLDELLALLAEDDATGTGSLYGRLPVQLDGTKISYGQAFLYAEPGLGDLSILDPDALLEDLPPVARGALANFRYSVLKLRFDPTGEKDAVLRLRGRSRDPSFPRELILDLRIDGFKDLLDSAIIVDRMSKGVRGR